MRLKYGIFIIFKKPEIKKHQHFDALMLLFSFSDDIADKKTNKN
jgi:hypothetical protein